MRTLNQVKDIFHEAGCELLETEYKNSSTKMRYIAQCGHEHNISLENFRAGKGRLCKECRYNAISSNLKYTYEYIKDTFEKEGCVLITTEYKSATDQKLEYIAQCGHTNYTTFTKFKNGSGRVCNKCSKSIKYEYDYVAEAFDNKGCILLEEQYVNCKTPMQYIATCGHKSTITFDAFLNADSVPLTCPDCQKINHYTIDDVRKIFADNGCQLLTNEFKRITDKLEYIAQCNHKNKISLAKFLDGKGQGRVCRYCSRPRGEDHHAYNPLLTDQDRQKRDFQSFKNAKVRKKVFERDHYTCQICGDSTGGNLEAHHLDGWSYCKEKRFDENNEVTLCRECHRDFHKKYKYGNNTKQQFMEYMKMYDQKKKKTG